MLSLFGKLLKDWREPAVPAIYGHIYVADKIEGLITVPAAELEIEDVHNLYVARTYAYVAGGHHGVCDAGV